MIFNNYDISVRNNAVYDVHMDAYRTIYNELFATQWQQENKYGRGVKCKRILAYNAWLAFKMVLADDLALYNVINPTITSNQIYALNDYNKVLNCFRCAAIEIDPITDASIPPMDLNMKPYYYGLSESESLTSAQIIALLRNDLAKGLNIKIDTFTGDPVYIYFVYPTEWGEVTDIIESNFDNIDAFDVDFDTVYIPTLAGDTKYTVVRSLDLHEIIAPINIIYK